MLCFKSREFSAEGRSDYDKFNNGNHSLCCARCGDGLSLQMDGKGQQQPGIASRNEQKNPWIRLSGGFCKGHYGTYFSMIHS